MSKMKALVKNGPKVAAYKVGEVASGAVFSTLSTLNPAAFGRCMDWGAEYARNPFKDHASDSEAKTVAASLLALMACSSGFKRAKSEFQSEWNKKKPEPEARCS